MVYCNTKDILDSALTKIIDNSAGIRADALSWLNEVIGDLAAQPRQWKFLETSTSLTITDNAITLPTDFNQLICITVGDYIFLPSGQLTDEEAAAYASDADTTPVGFTLSGNTITFVPGTDETTCTFKYEKMLTSAVTDSVSDTVFPRIFRNFFITGVRMHYYDYDKDGRYGKEVVLYQDEMNKVKAWDNQLKTIPKWERHGYLR